MKRCRLLFAAALAAALLSAAPAPRWGGELRLCLRADPRTFDPMQVAEETGETIRYLTGGVLLRLDRVTQQLLPELAESWKLTDAGRGIEFTLRRNVRFSDGSPFTAEDAAYTLRKLMDPATHAPVADTFGGGPVAVTTPGAFRLRAVFPKPVAGMERLFDQVAIVKHAAAPGRAAWDAPTVGPYRVAEYKAGAHVLLTRNPNYWRTGPGGRRLPYIDSIRLLIQQNRNLEILRFSRGGLDLIHRLDPEDLERLGTADGWRILDMGPSLSSEQLWFNQVAAAPMAAHKKEWFRSRDFRLAVSEAISRADICRVVYRNRATPAAGPVSPANRFWYNGKLRPPASDPGAALARLSRAGFERRGGTLRDRAGNPVEFSVITNAGNKARERIAAMLQQDLLKIGVRVHIAALDFPSLIERITRSFDYDACLLGLVNVELDPNAQMNVWLSSAANHQWNPGQKSPATPWEAEIDRLMLAQSSASSPRKRKAAFDRVQEIVAAEAPFLYLINRNALAAVSTRVRGLAPSVLAPETFWNIESLWLESQP